MVRYGAGLISLLCASVVAFCSFVGQTDAVQASALRQEFVLKESIQQYWEEGYRITDAAYGDGLWAAVMTEGTGYERQAWELGPVFPEEFINEKWDEGLDLTTLAYGDGMWFAVMSGGLDWQQAFRTGTFEDIKAFFDENPDHMITEIAYGDGEWVAVLSKMEEGRAQYWRLSPEWPVDAIAERWDQGYSITDVAYGPSAWFVVMTRDAGYAMDRVRRRVEWPADDIGQDYADTPEGSVVTLDYGDGLWAYTYAITEWSGRQAVVPAAVPLSTAPSEPSVPAETVSTPMPAATDERVEDIRSSMPDAAYDFEWGSGGWELLYDDEYATFLRDGAYHVTVDAQDVVAWGYGEDIAGDFYAEADVRFVGGTVDSEGGLAFRCTDSDNCYFFLLDPEGTYSLQTLVDGEWEVLATDSVPELVETGEDATNRLGVLARGDEIALFVNDAPLTEVVDDSIAGAGFGLAASAYDAASVEFAFDNFSLWDLDAEAVPVATSAPEIAPTVPAPMPTPEPTAVSGTGPDAEDRADVLGRVEAIRATEPAYRYGFGPDEQWEVYSTADTVRYLVDDALRMRVVSEEYTDWTYLEPAPSDFYLELDVRYRETPGHAMSGVLFRMGSGLNYYRFAFSPTGTYSLVKRVDGAWELLTEWNASDMPETADRDVNRLGILAEGSRIALFANDELVGVAEDDSLVQGDIALAVVTYDAGNVEVEFDNVTLWDLDEAGSAGADATAPGIPLPASKEAGSD